MKKVSKFWGNVSSGGKALTVRKGRGIWEPILGVMGYLLIPTLLQAVTRKNLSGYLGFILSVGLNVIIGLGFKMPKYVTAVIAAAFAHVWYMHVNTWFRDTTGQWTWAFDPTVASQNNMGISDSLQPGAESISYGNKDYTMYEQQQIEQDTQPEPMKDNYSTLHDNYSRTLSDNYASQLDGAYDANWAY